MPHYMYTCCVPNTLPKSPKEAEYRLRHATTVRITMLTILEVARRLGRNPETIRRWIREIKLPTVKVGTQHLIAGEDLRTIDHDVLPLPAEWEATITGEPMPKWVNA